LFESTLFGKLLGMAKKGRVVALKCTECKAQNYITKRNKTNLEGKLETKKFCRRCKKKTLHKETEDLK